MAERQPTHERREHEQSPEQRREDEANAERLRNAAEREAAKAERSPDDLKESRHEVERVAGTQEETVVETAPERPEQRPEVATKQTRHQAYDTHMSEARSHMKPVSRTFSKVIHNRAVETVSDAAGKTVARPNAVLAGSFTAFVLVLGVFLVARHYGYPLSGSETIVAFAAGWVLGILFDYLRVMITGRHQ